MDLRLGRWQDVLAEEAAHEVSPWDNGGAGPDPVHREIGRSRAARTYKHKG